MKNNRLLTVFTLLLSLFFSNTWAEDQGQLPVNSQDNSEALTLILNSVLIDRLKGANKDRKEIEAALELWEERKLIVQNEIKRINNIRIILPSKPDLTSIKQGLKKIIDADSESARKEHYEKLAPLFGSYYINDDMDIYASRKTYRVSTSIFGSLAPKNESEEIFEDKLDQFFKSKKQIIGDISNKEKFPSFKACREMTKPVSDEGLFELAQSCFSDLNNYSVATITQESIAKLKNKSISYLNEFLAFLDIEISSLNQELSKSDDAIKKLESQISNAASQQQQRQSAELERIKRGISTNEIELITITLIGFCVIIISVLVAITIMVKLRSNNGEISDSFSYPLFLELVTVFVLAVILIILGLANKINNEALAALIGGISGYVLGRLKEQGAPNSRPNKPMQPTPESGAADD